MTAQAQPMSSTTMETGTVVKEPLNRLQEVAQQRSIAAREGAIEALAASITANSLLQAPVLAPEIGKDGAATGSTGSPSAKGAA